MKFFLMESVVFGDEIQNPTNKQTEKGEEVFINKFY